MIYEVYTVLHITVTAFWKKMPSSLVERGTNVLNVPDKLLPSRLKQLVPSKYLYLPTTLNRPQLRRQ